MSVTIRLARPAEAALLPPIERSAGESFRTIPGYESWADGAILPAEFHARHIAAGTVRVAVEAGAPVGFVCAERVGREIHIWEPDVRRATIMPEALLMERRLSWRRGQRSLVAAAQTPATESIVAVRQAHSRDLTRVRES